MDLNEIIKKTMEVHQNFNNKILTSTTFIFYLFMGFITNYLRINSTGVFIEFDVTSILNNSIPPTFWRNLIHFALVFLTEAIKVFLSGTGVWLTKEFWVIIKNKYTKKNG